MKKNFLILTAVAVLLAMTSCGDESENPVGEKLLSGQINGIDWEFAYGKGFYSSVENNIDTELYSQIEGFTDGCDIFSTGEPHLRIRGLPVEEGSYFIPGDINVVFEQDLSNSVTATSGTLEVTGYNGRRLTAILEANFDAENTVSGSFVFDVCNQ